jgi:alpha-L-fucosidase
MKYQRADTEWLARCHYGLSVHWTAQTLPREGQPVSFQEAVESFDVERFASAVDEAGADYVIFTVTHALQFIPAPLRAVDEILPGRTARRDLIGELAKRLHRDGRHLILYYNHSCNSGDDPEWERAVGYHNKSKEWLVRNLFTIVEALGRRYGELVPAWWFDSSYSLDPRGPHNTVTTDMTGFQFPWEDFTRVAKLGHPQRLVCYNAGIASDFLYTAHQDYAAGEFTDLSRPATSRFLDNGLQWHGWTCLDDRAWVYSKPAPAPVAPLYADEELFRFVLQCAQHAAPVCFNVLCYQDGSIPESSIACLQQLGKRLRGETDFRRMLWGLMR